MSATPAWESCWRTISFVLPQPSQPLITSNWPWNAKSRSVLGPTSRQRALPTTAAGSPKPWNPFPPPLRWLTSAVQFITGVAANIFNAGVVMGEPVTNWRELDLQAIYGSMTINGEVVGDGHGSDVMGHPLEPLAWLANKLAEQGLGLSAGMVIITGSIVPPKPVKPGDTASIMIEGLGSAGLNVV